MCKKKNSGMLLGAVILGCGVAAGAYLAKKYYDKRKMLLKNYNVEVDRLQNEVDFDYSEEFLKELKKETLNADKKQLSREDVLKTLNDIKDASNEHIKRLENVLKEHLKKEEAMEEAMEEAKEEPAPVQIVIEEDLEEITVDEEAPADTVEDACFDFAAEDAHPESEED
jgi:recombination DNA repair RAD52 pathway protein